MDNNKNMYDSYIKNINNNSHTNNTNSKLETQLPNSPTSERSFSDFYKITKAYHKELKNVTSNNQNLSKDDVIVLNDLVRELNSYINILVRYNFIEEGKVLLLLGIKISDFLLKIFNNLVSNEDKSNLLNNMNSVQNKILFPFSLKLLILESKFNLHFNVENNYEESENVLNEIIKIQNIIRLPKFNLGCSTFYMAMIKFCKNFFWNLYFKKIFVNLIYVFFGNLI
jgi:hypothetical protein